ncbi:hypothetical protein [Mesobacterium pallidum]|uniref:hypothetical protein n=1 Tax=Mesobacterium pallidum TaxID=2872037 RepID=UPI001EE16F6A|nr:hypothetical protein [Mesobacterium pallidum]
MRAAILALCAGLSLSACKLDKEESLRSLVSDWLFLDETYHFTSKATCTVAVFRLTSSEVKMAVPRARDVQKALRLIRGGRPVLFDMAGSSPNAVSEQVMSKALEEGLGLISTVTGPSETCMDDEAILRGFARVVMADATLTLYDAGRNMLILIYPPENLAFVLRGNV